MIAAPPRTAWGAVGPRGVARMERVERAVFHLRFTHGPRSVGIGQETRGPDSLRARQG